MPDFTFELPHWVYWSGLVIFPLIAMAMSRRSVTMGEHERTLPISYFTWLTGGLLGFHRFYLRNLWGLLYLPLFLAILYANGREGEAREVYSEQANIVKIAEGDIQRSAEKLGDADDVLAELRAAFDATEEGSFSRRSAEKKLERAEKRFNDMRERAERAEIALVDARPALAEATANRTFWQDIAKYAFFGILAFMALDAVIMPWLVKNARRKAPKATASQAEAAIAAHEEAEVADDAHHISTGWTGWIDRLNYFAGEFVSYWAVIAVFVYYFEVVSRYVFNSPTNWAHEGMFLMFGMQYLIAGSYAMMTESHVRVDIFYAKWSVRRKAIVDILTSIFFFIFAGVLFYTSWIFASDATKVNELSVTEWQVAYWPVKWMMVVGAVLLILQGISKLAKDFQILATGDDGSGHTPGAAADMREAV